MTGLYDGVELLSLDAGNTVIFLDHARMARFAGVDRDALVVAEGYAKRALSGMGDVTVVRWSHENAPGARGWGKTVATMLAHAGVPVDALASLMDRIWASHVEHNFWSVVPEGFADAMGRVRAAGVKTAIVSNSEGMLEPLFTELGILGCFDTVVDSARVGFEKPDPRIFAVACERTGTTAAHALHLGDTYATDIVGARNAGMRTAMIDPYHHYEGLYPDVPRVNGVVEVADVLATHASSALR